MPSAKHVAHLPEYYAAIATSIKDAVVATDNDLNIVYWNKGAEEMYGVKEKDAIGKYVGEVYTTKLIDISLDEWKSIMKKKGHWEGETIHITKAGKRMYTRNVTSVVYNEEGNAIGAVAVTIDITAEKEAKEKVFGLNRSLQERIEELQTLFDVIPIGVAISTDATCTTITGNTAFSQMFYTKKGQNVSRTAPASEQPPFKTYINGEEVSGEALPMQQAGKTGKIIRNIEITTVRGDNTPIIHLSSAAPIFDEEKKVRAVVGVLLDITEQREAENRKDDFIAMASHELKTPLTSAKIYTHIIKKALEKSHNTESQKYIAKIDSQLDLLTKLIQGLLDLQHIEKGELILKNETFYLSELANEVIEDIEYTTSHKFIVDLKTHYPFYADKERIRQVFVNLITNAIKYSPEGKEIIIRSRKREKNVVVSVQDFGIGIPKDQQDKVFNRFFQASKHNTYPGLGLGLYISFEIIKANGGKIWVESEEGKGSIFYFTLPIKMT